jgi:hypothetical protein
MSNASKWFEQEVPEQKKNFDHSRNWPFYMDVDTDVRICILNDDDTRIPPIHYHSMYHDGKPKRVLCTAAKNLGGSCPLCDYTAAQPESERWKTKLNQEFCYTVLVDTYEKGKEPKKCLRLSTIADHNIIQRLRETARNKMDKEGLKNVWIEVIRPSNVDKAPRIGKISQILGDLDVSLYDEEFLAPFTEEEILVQFVQDKDEMEEIYKDYSIEAKSGKSKIRDVN